MARNKYAEIVDALGTQIETGKYKVGDRIPSENQLALRFGVSRPTAARALSDLETAGMVERRTGSGTYVRRTSPVGEKGTNTLGLLVQGLGGTEIFDPICTEITRVCQEEGSVVLWGDATKPDDNADEVERLCRYYMERKVDGVFFAPLEAIADREQENIHIASKLEAAGITVVLLDRDVVDFPRRSKFDLVGIDNFQAGLEIAQHLVDVGHTRISFLARPHHPDTTDLRVAGCRVALERAGLEVSDAFHQSGDPSDETFVRALVEREQPEAVICSNDLTAALLAMTLAHLGLQVPKHMAVVGFDDVKYSTLLQARLTTMRQPFHGIAKAAVDVMDDRIRDPHLDPRRVLLHAELVIRQSSGGAFRSTAASRRSSPRTEQAAVENSLTTLSPGMDQDGNARS